MGVAHSAWSLSLSLSRSLSPSLSNGPQTQEIELRYDDKAGCSGEGTCSVSFTIGEGGLDGPVFLCVGPLLPTFRGRNPETDPWRSYYQLTSFYQNVRTYHLSRSYKQLRGIDMTAADAADRTAGELEEDCGRAAFGEDGKVLVPCGLIAASYFRDSFVVRDGSGGEVAFAEEVDGLSITWPRDASMFANTTALLEAEGGADAEVTVANPVDPHFMVWMRTAALPFFRKLYGISRVGLPAGAYTVDVDSRFDTASISAGNTQVTKSVVISTASMIGGRNPFMGWAYLTIGALLLLTGVAFVLMERDVGRDFGQFRK